jgi:hypothetical protein
LIVFGCDGNVDNPNQGNPPAGTGGASGSGSGGSGGSATGGAGGQTQMPDANDTTDGDGTTTDGGASQCIPAVPNPPDGHHNPGANCLMCHDQSQMAPNLRWTVAGTLFDGISSTNPTPGATIEIIDANGQRLLIPTATNGNFWTALRVRFPLQVRASECPADLKMMTQTFQGSCNGCHVPGMRIHLP